MICQKFARKVEFKNGQTCLGFSPNSCGNCPAGSIEQLHKEIDKMVADNQRVRRILSHEKS